MEDALVVFTARGPDQVISEGGSQAWKLDAVRAKKCTWLVCTQNQHNPDQNFSTATMPHGAAFLVGRISGVVRSPEDLRSDRWMISISEYALVNVPGAWDGRRNPVRYGSIDEFDIDLASLMFIPMEPPPATTARFVVPSPVSPTSMNLATIAGAKKALAAAFGVSPDAVEITIRG